MPSQVVRPGGHGAGMITGLRTPLHLRDRTGSTCVRLLSSSVVFPDGSGPLPDSSRFHRVGSLPSLDFVLFKFAALGWEAQFRWVSPTEGGGGHGKWI